MKLYAITLSLIISNLAFGYDLKTSSRPVGWKLECSSKGVSDIGYILHLKAESNGYTAQVSEDGMFGGPQLFSGQITLLPDNTEGKCKILISDRSETPTTRIVLSPDGEANDIAVIQKVKGVDYQSKEFSTLQCLFANNFREELPKCAE